MTSRIFPFVFSLLFAALTVVLLSDEVRSADLETMTVEQGQLIIIDALALTKARPSADVTEATNNNPNAGTVQITADKKKISYLAAKDGSGRDLVSYKVKDAAANQDYTGQVEITVTVPQRITTFNYSRVAGVLGIILVLATVLEIGLATIFSWKYFQDNLEGKGLRTPIAVATSIFFVWYYKLDVISDLLSSFTDNAASFGKTVPGYIVTSFIVAGGSGTVNKLFAALGLRPPAGDKSGQLIINLTRQKVPANATVSVSIDGVVVGAITSGNRFPSDNSKFPLSLGSHKIDLTATDGQGASISAQQTVTVAAGADAVISMVL